jgi:DNA-binding response OmpR family regulator
MANVLGVLSKMHKSLPTLNPHILIVEDDIELAEWMSDYLTAKEYRITITNRGDDAVTIIQQKNPDLVILDGILPGLDGLDVCKAVRPTFTNAIIMVTARDEEIDEVLGLEMGDYLNKPVRARALLTRIRKHLERQRQRQNETANETVRLSPQLRFDNLIIDPQARVVSLEGTKIKLSSNEFDLLWFLAIHAGQVVTRDQLLSQFRGFEYDGFDRSIDLRISRLRKKLKDNPSEPFRIKTIRGEGYLFAQEAW